MAPTVRSQNLSIMLTDMQGYSETAANASREELVTLIRKHNQLMRPVIEAYGGSIIKTIGDAFLCTFPGATNAVICAIIIQLLLKEYNHRVEGRPDAQKLNLRVVINSGDVTLEDNDIFGTAVNITSRMEALECFPGGTIGISESTHLMMDRTEIIAEKIGPQTLKGVPEPVVVYKVPLEKQKLNKLPLNLSMLVEKVVNSKGDESVNMKEWYSNINNFLKQTNWSDGIDFASQKLGAAKASLVKTFGKKTVLENNSGNLAEAPLVKRAMSFAIDWAIIIVFSILLNIAWWPVHRMAFGISESETMQTGDNWEYRDGHYHRKTGFVEGLLNMSVQVPIIPMWIYFFLFWKIKRASLGQIAIGTAIVMEDNSREIEAAVVAKRSVIYLLACFLPFLHLAMIVGEKKALYDKYSQTKVVC